MGLRRLTVCPPGPSERHWRGKGSPFTFFGTEGSNGLHPYLLMRGKGGRGWLKRLEGAVDG